MRRIFAVFIVLACFLLDPNDTKGAPTLPCSLVLEPVEADAVNAKGVALAAKVKLTPSFPRTSVSIHAIHLSVPSSLGDYDGYEGFAFIANQISWRFQLYPTPETDSPTWAGRLDDITAVLDDSVVEVRLANSKTGKLGPAVLRNRFRECKQ